MDVHINQLYKNHQQENKKTAWMYTETSSSEILMIEIILLLGFYERKQPCGTNLFKECDGNVHFI